MGCVKPNTTRTPVTAVLLAAAAALASSLGVFVIMVGKTEFLDTVITRTRGTTSIRHAADTMVARTVTSETAQRDLLDSFVVSDPPSDIPSLVPSLAPPEIMTGRPSLSASASPSPSLEPDQATMPPTGNPTSPAPSNPPTLTPSTSISKTASPTPSTTVVSFQPGTLNPILENGLRLSVGLTSRIFARSYEPVVLYNNNNNSNETSYSQEVCHHEPDGGATFVDPRPDNPGGWIYVSNSEDRTNSSKGGAGAFTFDKDGNVIDYKMVLNGTEHNCNGGKTPWNTWISCEETSGGRVWEVDPTGIHTPQVTSIGKEGGVFEAFAYSLDTADTPQFFVTEDHETGALRRFRPDAANFGDPWSILYGNGTQDYLVLDAETGTFDWTEDIEKARSNANETYPFSEGVIVVGNRLYFVAKHIKTLFTLNLVSMVYTNQSTLHGAFEGEPDSMTFLAKDGLATVYFTEDEGEIAGIFGRDRFGTFYTILECPGYIADYDETTGIAFSPDRRHLYFALQVNGLLFDITRTDGLPFDATTLPIKYSGNRRRRSA